MKKLLILSAFVLATVALPLQFTWAYDSKGEAYFGGWSKHGEKVAFGWSVGETSILLKDTVKNYEAGLYKGYFSADRELDDVQGASVFLMVSRFVPLSSKTTFSLTIGVGGLYQIKDDEDETNLDLMLKPGIKIFNFAHIALFGCWLPQKGSDASYFGLSIDLSP